MKLIEVKKGDSFNYEIEIKLTGDDISAFAGIDAFNEDKKAINWNYDKIEVNESNKWCKVVNTSVINDDISYIRFRLSGLGEGEYRFDNICFRKEN